MTEKNEYFFKVCVTGDWGIGKTSLVLRYVEDDFLDDPQETLGVDFKTKAININGKTIKLKVCDTAGQERFKAITASFYRGSQGVIVMFDVTDQETFSNIPHWMDEVERYANDGANMVLVGTKVDLPNRVVDNKTAKQFADKHKMGYFEISSKTGECVDEVFHHLGNKMYKRIILAQREETSKSRSITLKEKIPNSNQSKKTCCK